MNAALHPLIGLAVAVAAHQLRLLCRQLYLGATQFYRLVQLCLESFSSLARLPSSLKRLKMCTQRFATTEVFTWKQQR